jgi:hypothetical protein
MCTNCLACLTLCLYYLNDVWGAVPIIKLLIIRSSPSSFHVTRLAYSISLNTHFCYNPNISTDGVRQPKHHIHTKLQTNTSVCVLTFNCQDWWWRLHISLKCQYISIIIHGVISEMTIIFRYIEIYIYIKSTQLFGYIVLKILNSRYIYKKGLVFEQNRFTDVASMGSVLSTLVLVGTSMNVPRTASPRCCDSG